MKEPLTEAGYEQTCVKLDRLRRRLALIEAREDLSPMHKQEVRKSYQDTIRQLAEEVALYEANLSARAREGH